MISIGDIKLIDAVRIPEDLENPHAYFHHSSAPNALPIYAVLSYEERIRHYSEDRLSIELLQLFEHEFAHRILAQIGIFPWDNFSVPEDILRLSARKLKDYRYDILNDSNEDKLFLMTIGYRRNSNKIPFLRSMLIKEGWKGANTSDISDIYDLLNVNPLLKNLFELYYEAIDMDSSVSEAVKSFLKHVEGSTGTVIDKTLLNGIDNLSLRIKDEKLLSEEERDTYRTEKKVVIQKWTEIRKVIANYKKNNPQAYKPIRDYSIRNMHMLLEIPFDQIAAYFQVEVPEVEEVIANDSFCQRLQSLKEYFRE